MQRTQIYLGEAELALLERESQRTGASRSELVRRAILDRYGARSQVSRLAALDASAGVWQDRDVTGAEYVDAVRGDLQERLQRLGWS